jgi:antitoxin MazE
MIKKLAKHGNSLALVIDKAILDLLHIDADTPLDISTDGRSLTITPVRDKVRRKAFDAALGKTIRRRGRVLKRLADS